MTDPITGIAAATILKLAFDEFVKSSAGEAAKTLTGAALAKANELRAALWSRFRGNAKAEKALTEAEQGSVAAMTRLEVYLDDEMTDDPNFAAQVQQLAGQVLAYRDESQATFNQQFNNHGRDQITINNPGQIGKLGGS